MDYLSNANHTISVVVYWIFDSNDEKSLVLYIEYLVKVTEFETVFTAVRYILSTAQLKRE